VGNVVTQQNPALGPERLWGGEVGLNHTPSPRLSWRGTAFWDDVSDPIANVTLSSTAALITRQRQNLGRSRVRGLSFEGDMAPAPELRVQARYLFSDSRVVEFAATPEIEGNLLPQVPRHRASLRLDYSQPRVLDVSITGRYESVRFDDDQNRVSLDAFFVAGLSVARAVARSWTVFVSADNLFDSRYAVQGTPVESLGTPLTLSAGLRFELRPH
jgi:outer membrane receptor protein involved in Fe transport